MALDDQRPHRARRAAGALEAEVLGVLWAADRPLTPTEILVALDADLAYNTVHTIVTRLNEKGVLTRESHNGRALYTPVRGAAQDAAERMRGALESGGERAAILQHFVTALSADDERALRAALQMSDGDGPV